MEYLLKLGLWVSRHTWETVGVILITYVLLAIVVIAK